MRVGGIVLCGGRSSRMGRPKAWLPLGGELLLPRVVRIVGEVATPVVVVASAEQDLPALPPNTELVPDEVEGRGPLQGLAAGLAALQGRADAVFASSCDVPFLRPAFIRRLIDLIGDHLACVPHVGSRHHPLASVYRPAVLEAVTKLLAEGRLSATVLTEQVPTRVVTESELADVDPDLQSLWNVNTPADYEAALRHAAGL